MRYANNEVMIIIIRSTLDEYYVGKTKTSPVLSTGDLNYIDVMYTSKKEALLGLNLGLRNTYSKLLRLSY